MIEVDGWGCWMESVEFPDGSHRYGSCLADEEIWRRRSLSGPCSSLVIASSSSKPLHLLSRAEPPPFTTPFPLLLSAETMENDSFRLWLLLSLVSREVCFEERPSGSSCYMALLGFLLLCARHIGLRCRDKMVMLERRIPVCHLCLGMIQGADSQD